MRAKSFTKVNKVPGKHIINLTVDDCFSKDEGKQQEVSEIMRSTTHTPIHHRDRMIKNHRIHNVLKIEAPQIKDFNVTSRDMYINPGNLTPSSQNGTSNNTPKALFLSRKNPTILKIPAVKYKSQSLSKNLQSLLKQKRESSYLEESKQNEGLELLIKNSPIKRKLKVLTNTSTDDNTRTPKGTQLKSFDTSMKDTPKSFRVRKSVTGVSGKRMSSLVCPNEKRISLLRETQKQVNVFTNKNFFEMLNCDLFQNPEMFMATDMRSFK